MNMIAKKLLRTTAHPPVNGEDVLAELDRRLAEIDARDKVLLELQINLEKTSAPGRTDLGVLAQAEELLEGKGFVASPVRPMAQLDAVIAERATIKRAMEIGLSKKHRLATERATEIWAAHFDQIAQVEKRRVMLALELQRANRDRERLREKIIKAGGAGYLSTDGVDLLGLGDIEENVKWVCERLIADGIVSRAEIEKARSDG
jgi:hypothetical protein